MTTTTTPPTSPRGRAGWSVWTATTDGYEERLVRQHHASGRRLLAPEARRTAHRAVAMSVEVRVQRASATLRNGGDTQTRFTCAFESIRAGENSRCVAHNLEIFARLPTPSRGRATALSSSEAVVHSAGVILISELEPGLEVDAGGTGRGRRGHPLMTGASRLRRLHVGLPRGAAGAAAVLVAFNHLGDHLGKQRARGAQRAYGQRAARMDRRRPRRPENATISRRCRIRRVACLYSSFRARRRHSSAIRFSRANSSPKVKPFSPTVVPAANPMRLKAADATTVS
jgi:hypothetical protein